MAGRPQANIDWKKVGDLLTAGCSGREIAGYLGLDPSTIYLRCEQDHGLTFSQYSQQFYEKGNSLLRTQQFKKAVEGDNSMLIWLGKNRLKQSDSPVQDEISKEASQKLDAFMNQIKSAQTASSAPKIADSSSNNDSMS